jgi:ribosomal protein S20
MKNQRKQNLETGGNIMQMTNEEICQSYQQAKHKAKQIQILAELNVCTKEEILAVLEAEGITVGHRTKGSLQQEHKPVKEKTEAPENKSVPSDWKTALKAIQARITELKHQKETIENELNEIYSTLGAFCRKEQKNEE